VKGRRAEEAHVPEARPAPEADLVEDDDLDTDVPVPVSGEPGLDERAEEILAFERRWWKHAGAKEQAIRDTFDLSPTRYYQLVNTLLDRPAALAYDPVLVKRLRRLRASRSRRRT
jgi:hypothetical protein